MLSGHSFGTTNVLFGSWKFDIMRAMPTGSMWNNGVQNQVRATSSGTPIGAAVSVVGQTTLDRFQTVVMVGNPLAANTSYDFDFIFNARL